MSDFLSFSNSVWKQNEENAIIAKHSLLSWYNNSKLVLVEIIRSTLYTLIVYVHVHFLIYQQRISKRDVHIHNKIVKIHYYEGGGGIYFINKSFFKILFPVAKVYVSVDLNNYLKYENIIGFRCVVRE